MLDKYTAGMRNKTVNVVLLSAQDIRKRSCFVRPYAVFGARAVSMLVPWDGVPRCVPYRGAPHRYIFQSLARTRLLMSRKREDFTHFGINLFLT